MNAGLSSANRTVLFRFNGFSIFDYLFKPRSKRFSSEAQFSVSVNNKGLESRLLTSLGAKLLILPHCESSSDTVQIESLALNIRCALQTTVNVCHFTFAANGK